MPLKTGIKIQLQNCVCREFGFGMVKYKEIKSCLFNQFYSISWNLAEKGFILKQPVMEKVFKSFTEVKVPITTM